VVGWHQKDLCYNPWDFVKDGKWFLSSAKDVEALAERADA
jgi:hypothetical protein